MGKRKGKCVKNNKASKQDKEPEHLVKAPHSFVIHRGQCSKDIMDLTKDFRKIMEPFTASQLKERKTNSIKDFLSVAGYLNVSHMMVFTETDQGSYMKLARTPRGPTLTFQIQNYTLARDVVSAQKKPFVTMRAYQNAPLIVLNSFSGEGMHMKLMATMFQNMFPTINVTNAKLKNIRRCVLMNYNPETKLIDFRHYIIRAVPVGLNKGTKKVVQGKVPNLKNCKDMTEFFDKAGFLSESECEDDPESQVVLPQDLASRGALEQCQSAIKLSELGPRITMQLFKIESGFMDGEVLYHELVSKTEEEKELIRQRREENQRAKESRSREQMENVMRKEREKEELKQKALDGILKKHMENERLSEQAMTESRSEGDQMEDDDEDDDAEYYRREVGAEPDKDLYPDDVNSSEGEINSSEGETKQKNISSHQISSKKLPPSGSETQQNNFPSKSIVNKKLPSTAEEIKQKKKDLSIKNFLSNELLEGQSQEDGSCEDDDKYSDFSQMSDSEESESDMFSGTSNLRKRKSDMKSSSNKALKKMRISESRDYKSPVCSEHGGKAYSHSGDPRVHTCRSKQTDKGKNNYNLDRKKKFQDKAGNRKFQGRNGNRKFQNKDGGRGKNSDKGFKQKKVFGGKFNKNRKGASKKRG